jgi:poly-beta-1,6-N-acetyl-D-glucosamine N-deacetylase
MLKIGFFSILLSLTILTSDVLSAGRVNCFIYHRFDESRYPSTNISAEVFLAQLSYLKEQGYEVLSLSEIARRLQNGEPLPEKGAALSVDDAFQSFYQVAMPILRRFDFPVTLFVNTDAVASPGYLDWQQLQQLQSEGVEIGNHSASHDYLVEMRPGEDFPAWRNRVRSDIRRAQMALETHLDKVARIFAYPYGEYVPELFDIVKELGFEAAFAQQSGVISLSQNPFYLPRFPMGGSYASLAGFKTKLAMKPLAVSEEQPQSPLLTDRDNPPELLIRIADLPTNSGPFNCFVQGDNSCKIEAMTNRTGWYRVSAATPLTGRRNKYTLTNRGKGGWYWYSHLWLQAERPVGSASASKAQAGVGEAAEAILQDQ